MKKVKFDFDATKQNIFVNQNAAVPVGAPVDQIGAVANNGNAIGIVIGAKKQVISGRFVKNLVVMVAGYCDIIDAQEIWGDEYSAEAKSAMSDIVFCDDHKIGGGGGWPADLPKPSVGGYGYTEQGNQTVITWDGDTEGRDSITDALFKVSDEVPNDAEISSGVIAFNDGESGIVGSGFQFGDTAMAYVDGSLVIASAPGQIVTEDFTIDIPSAGVYFLKTPGGFIASLTYGTPDTIHKIDEKYLPASGGGGVFEIFYTHATNTVDKTYAEIKQAYYAGKNVTLRIGGDVILQVSMMPMSDDDSDIVFSGLADIDIDTQATELQSANVYQVTISSNESVQYEQGYFGF